MKEVFLDAKALAKLLNVSLRTVENLVKAKKLPAYVRVGHQRRWRRSDIEEFFAVKQREAEEASKGGSN